MTHITIIGFGLIGSSLARALKNGTENWHITAADMSDAVCKEVLDHHLADAATSDIPASVENADIVIMAVPVGAMAGLAAQIAPHMLEGAILTDVGSVKNKVAETVQDILPDGIAFVPGHPIAGTEKSGPLSGFAELFNERWVILTPLPATPMRAIEAVTRMWEQTGAKIDIMTPQHHDLVLGITSHLPHLIAYTIVGTATNLEDDIQSEVVKYSASGFRDFTRIAASDPTMWRDIFLNNKEAVLEILQRFTEDLTGLQRAIRYGDGDYLHQTFDRTRTIRKAVVEANQ